MPSEKIYGSDGVDVRVAWGSTGEGVVQIATLAANKTDPHEATDRMLAIVNQWLRDSGQPEIDVAAMRAGLSYTPDFDGWHASLNDWPELNRLIQVLKRARDRAFGVAA